MQSHIKKLSTLKDILKFISQGFDVSTFIFLFFIWTFHFLQSFFYFYSFFTWQKEMMKSSQPHSLSKIWPNNQKTFTFFVEEASWLDQSFSAPSYFLSHNSSIVRKCLVLWQLLKIQNQIWKSLEKWYVLTCVWTTTDGLRKKI